MTMTNVIANYLRWFRLHRAKKAILNDMAPVRSHIPWTQALRSKGRSPGWGLQSTFPAEAEHASPVLIDEATDKIEPEDEVVESYETVNTRSSKRA